MQCPFVCSPYTGVVRYLDRKRTGSGSQVDPEEVIRNAFGCFDPEGNKMIAEDQLKSILTTMGQDKMTEEEVEEFMAVAPFDAGGQYDLNVCAWRGGRE